MPNITEFDIIIAGGGLSGATMALSLADLVNDKNQPLSIAIVEPNPILTNKNTSSYDERVLALAYGSALFLNDIGVWQSIKPYATAIEQIHVSDLGHYGKARLYAKDYHVSALGYVVEMQKIGDALLTQLKHKQNIHWFEQQSISGLTYKNTNVQLETDQGQLMSTSLLLACDGGFSNVRTLSSITTTSKAYEQTALIANVRCQQPHNGKAFERFTQDGPLAMLPMNTDMCSLVWTLSPEKVVEVSAWNDKQFCDELTKRFGHWLGRVEQTGTRFSYPLNLTLATEQVRHRMALIGNASHTLHPIAGQGFNLGLRDIVLMRNLVVKQCEQGADIGDFSMLSQFRDRRVQDQQLTAQLTDSMVHVFSNDYFPMVVGRNLGLKALNYCQQAKSALAMQTMGFG